MTSVAVIVPVLDRPHQIEPLIQSLISSKQEVDFSLLFVLSPGRDDDLAAVRASGEDYAVCDFELGRGDFARKTNLGIEATDHDWIIAGATDLRFHPGWADEALRVADAEGKRFIGTQDLGNPGVLKGIHATHPVVHRSYVEDLGTIDELGKLYHEGYWHEWVDHEAVHTAKYRKEWAFAPTSVVEHLHPYFNKAERDWVYDRGHQHGRDDQRLFMQRRRLMLRQGRRAPR